jgi:hypothetical protein
MTEKGLPSGYGMSEMRARVLGVAVWVPEGIRRGTSRRLFCANIAPVRRYPTLTRRRPEIGAEMTSGIDRQRAAEREAVPRRCVGTRVFGIGK